jgi:hypothetical protein
MTPAFVLETALAAGIELSATPEGNIHWRCPGALPDRLRQLIGANKPELLSLLRATRCPKCLRPMDSRNRCWHCHDRTCEKCGRLTGTAFISLCLLCEVAERSAGTIANT